MLDVGTVLAGYRIEGLLGKGGMGVVYEATQLSLKRTVAFKLLAGELGEDPVFRERFRREALSQAALDHPNVVTVHEAGELEPDRPGAPPRLFIVMRLVRGATLKEMIRAGELDPARTLALLRPIADALDTAHGRGLVHRDVKPQNILVGIPGERAYLSDFGLMRGIDERSLTETGQLLGTLDYISPEQLEGETATARSDVYAFAAVAYECLCGSPPFRRESKGALVAAHLNAPRPRASEQRPELPAAVDEALVSGLAREPAERPASASALIQSIGTALGRKEPERETVPLTGADAPTTPLARRLPRGPGRRLAVAGAALLAAGVLVVGALVLPTGGSDGGHCGDQLVRNGTLADDTIGGTVGHDQPDGMQGDDCITVGEGDDEPSAGAGNDSVYGGGGNDTLAGGPGDDTLNGEQGSDILFGGSGGDRFRARDGTRDAIDCGPGNDTVESDDNDELVDPGSCEEVMPR
jgi:hypothetical protein